MNALNLSLLASLISLNALADTGELPDTTRLGLLPVGTTVEFLETRLFSKGLDNYELGQFGRVSCDMVLGQKKIPVDSDRKVSVGKMLNVSDVEEYSSAVHVYLQGTRKEVENKTGEFIKVRCWGPKKSKNIDIGDFKAIMQKAGFRVSTQTILPDDVQEMSLN